MVKVRYLRVAACELYTKCMTKKQAATLDDVAQSVNDIATSLADLATGIGAQFQAVDERFDAMDARFDAMDARFDAMDARFDAMDARVDQLTLDVQSARSEQVGIRQLLESIDNRLMGVESDITEIYDRIVALEEKHRLLGLTLADKRNLAAEFDRFMEWAQVVSKETGVPLPKI